MSAVGSLIFCVTCGNLLDSAVGKSKLNCGQCNSGYDAKKFADLSVVTTSADDAFPSALRLKRSVVKTQLGKDQLEEGAIVRINAVNVMFVTEFAVLFLKIFVRLKVSMLKITNCFLFNFLLDQRKVPTMW